MRPCSRLALAGSGGALALAITLGLSAPTAAAQTGTTEIGSVAAANPTIQGTPPGLDSRRLELGGRIYSDERIVTSEIGSGQFIFLDKTTLTVSSGSDIVLDRYVYDPDRGVGEVALSLSKGVLRFIGGQITKTGEATVSTPHATIGIRGGIAAITVGADGTNAVFLAGTNMCVSGAASGGQPLCVTRRGGLVRVRSAEAAEAEGGEAGEPTYEGTIGGDELADIFEATDTGGDGGTAEAVEPETVETLAASSGLTQQGTESPTATTTTTTTGDQGETTEEDPATEARSQPETSPVSGTPPGDLTTSQPIPGLTGQAFVAPTTSFTTDFGTQITDPTGRRVAEAPGSAFAFAQVFDGSRRGQTAAEESFLVPTPTTLGFYEFGDAFTGATLENGASPLGPISGSGFHDPVQDFTVVAFQTNAASPRVGFTFFGMPTAGQLVQTFGEAVTARRYDLSADLLWGIGAPLPPDFTNVFDIAGGTSLYLIPQPNETLLGDTALLGFDNPHRSKWMYGFLDIQGSGAGQSTLIAGLTSRVLPNDAAAPTSNAGARSFFGLGGGATVGSQRLVAGLVQDPAGNTVFGDNGQYLLWGTSAPFLADDNNPDIDFAVNDYTAFSRSTVPGGERGDVFGTLRLGTLEGSEGLGLLAARTPLAAPVAVSGWTPTVAVDQVFTGGYAAGAGQSHIPTGATIGDTLPDPYVFRSTDGTAVRMGFGAANNSAVAEFGPMSSFGSPDISGIALNFGNGATRDAMLDDNRFVMSEAFATTGALTGQTQSISGLGGTPVGTDGNQTAARATLLSAGLVGDGGIFPTGTITTPQWLRWGWWGASFAFDDSDPGAFSGRTETVPVGTWVSGVRSDVAALGTSGEATFDGLATAHITRTGGAAPASYVAGGRFLMTYDFGLRSGTTSITGLVDTILVGTVSEANATAGNHFGGVLRDAANFNAVGAIDGSFFTGGADPSAATAGGFNLTRPLTGGVTQTGAGIFAADKQ